MTPPEGDANERRTRRRRALGWVFRIALFVGLFLAISYYQQAELLPRGEVAPDFEAELLGGERVRLSDFAGKPVLLHFWATWCGVCRQEFSMLERLNESLGEDAVLLTVVADGDDPNLEQFLDVHGITYPVVRADRKLLSAYKVKAFPTNYFVDATGVVRSITVGMSTSWAMRTRLACSR